ncbi:MAG TPA: hypothetical protein VJ400_05095 [Thermoplasmata archaeon]|nr:hypothetical protein [Thermoplasmata archaeon]
MGKPTLDIRSLKEQAKGRQKALRLRAAITKMHLKASKLERRATKLRAKIKAFEEKADRLDQGIVPPRTG